MMILLPENAMTHQLPSDWRLVCEPMPVEPPDFRATPPESLPKPFPRAILHGGAEAADCDTVALYLLDAATSELQLRAAWGLPPDSFTQSVRALEDCPADLEAMTGHAVVLEDAKAMGDWNPPHCVAASACVPVASAQHIFGSLWFGRRQSRTFTQRDTNIMELVAGRLAAELEREAAMQEVSRRRPVETLLHETPSGEARRFGASPRVFPVLDGWDVTGWSDAGENSEGVFHDWFPLADDSLALVVAETPLRGPRAQCQTAALRAMLRAHAAHCRGPGSLLTRANRTLWSSTPGDQPAAALCVALHEATGVVRWSQAGAGIGLRSLQKRWRPFASPQPPLGLNPDVVFRPRRFTLQPGQALLLGTEAVDAVAASDRSGELVIDEVAPPHADLSATAILQSLRQELSSPTPTGGPHAQAALVARRD